MRNYIFILVVVKVLLLTNKAEGSPAKGVIPTVSDLPEPGLCGSQATQDRILGGNETGLDEFPWMALLEYNINDKILLGCGGSIIHPRFVLTAAHCIKSHLKSVRLGEYDTSTKKDCVTYYNVEDCSEAVSMEIDRIISYPGFDSEGTHDIALLKTKEPIQFGDFIKPICLPLQNRELPNKFFVAGWGETEKAEESSRKLKVEVPLYEKGKCVKTYKKMTSPIHVGATQICAGGLTGQDSCVGDSGGPLMAPIENANKEFWYQYGVVSFGSYPCGTTSPAIYTEVSKYLSWILEEIKK